MTRMPRSLTEHGNLADANKLSSGGLSFQTITIELHPDDQCTVLNATAQFSLRGATKVHVMEALLGSRLRYRDTVRLRYRDTVWEKKQKQSRVSTPGGLQ